MEIAEKGRVRNMKKTKRLAGRKFGRRFLAAIVTAVVLLSVIVLNICVQMAERKFPLIWDLTSRKVFELSEESIEFIRTVDEPVNISVMMDERTLESGGGYFAQAKQVLDQFPRYNGLITVEYVDIVKNPSIASAWPDLTLDYYDILVSCKGETWQTSLTELFNLGQNPSTGENYIISSKADQVLTSAIMRLTAEDTPQVLLLTGHGEQYTEEMISLLETNGYETVICNPLTEELSNEADYIMSLAPDRDYEEELLYELDDFLENGGDYNRSFLYAPADGAILPNLETWFSQWGIGIQTGIVVETDPNYVMNNLAYMCLTDYVGDEFLQGRTGEVQVMSPMGRPLEQLYEERSGYRTQVLLEYSENSCVMPYDADEDWTPAGEVKAAHPALLRSSFIQYDENGEKMSSVFVYAAPGYFEGSILESSSVANAEYFISMLNELSERENAYISVQPKQMGGTELGITQMEVYAGGILFVILLPVVVMAVGMVVWMYRRNR